MPIWLKGAGRSSKELARLLEEHNSGQDAHFRYRRAHSRHTLYDAYGDLIHVDSRVNARIPCRVLEISTGGCSLQTDEPFRHGALAPVEVFLPIAGMVLHIFGDTQWVKKECLMGIRFRHANLDSQNQLRCLIDCLLGRRSVESVMESIGSQKLNPASGDVLAVQFPGAMPAPPGVRPQRQSRLVYDRSIHCGEGRIYTRDEGEWPVVFQTLSNHLGFRGSIIDFSLGGCTIRAARPFFGDVNEPVEVHFKIHGQGYLLGGVTMAIYDAFCIGIQFDAMNGQQREELALQMAELCATSKTQLEVA